MNQLIVGLGNPGSPYALTRHNVGYMVLDRVHRPLPEGTDIRYGEQTWLLKPGVFMNASGATIQRTAAAHGVTPHDMLVICDDLNLPLGQLRLRGEGSAGGHHGLESVMAHVGTAAFPRLRIGIGAAPPGVDSADFVLSPFTPEEWRVMDGALTTATHAVAAWLHDGLAAAMNQFNRHNLETP